MALRGKAPTVTEKRLKAMFFGPAGVGKTTAAINFPFPYVIDAERGTEEDAYVNAINERGGARYQTADFDDLVAEVTTLMSTKHQFKTLVIDPFTGIYSQLLKSSAEHIVRTSKEKDITGEEFGRHYGVADKKVRHLINLIHRLDMNVIITCHAKAVYDDKMKIIDWTFDGYKKLDYLFDLVFLIQKRGKERVGIVRKTRVAGFPDGDTFPFNYDEIATRYGRTVLERDAVAEELATPEQCAEIVRLIALLNVSEETTDKWLEKAQAETWAEMPSTAIAKCIEHLKAKVEGVKQ